MIREEVVVTDYDVRKPRASGDDPPDSRKHADRAG